jgi:hypothetical protein
MRRNQFGPDAPPIRQSTPPTIVDISGAPRRRFGPASYLFCKSALHSGLYDWSSWKSDQSTSTPDAQRKTKRGGVGRRFSSSMYRVPTSGGAV